jgi:hypothetical protein
LVKYGYSSFSFQILEYCNQDETLVREQYYLDLLKPNYNILSKAGSPLGYKHTAESLTKMRGARNLTLDHLTKIREHISKLNNKRRLSVVVLDLETGIEVEYASIRLSARELNSNDRTIKRYIDSEKPYNGRYIIRFKPD